MENFSFLELVNHTDSRYISLLRELQEHKAEAHDKLTLIKVGTVHMYPFTTGICSVAMITQEMAVRLKEMLNALKSQIADLKARLSSGQASLRHGLSGLTASVETERLERQQSLHSLALAQQELSNEIEEDSERGRDPLVIVLPGLCFRLDILYIAASRKSDNSSAMILNILYFSYKISSVS